MHESRLVADLVANLPDGPVAEVRLRVGALAAVSPSGLRAGLGERLAARGAPAPVVEIEVGDDPTDPAALGVTLVSVRMGG